MTTDVWRHVKTGGLYRINVSGRMEVDGLDGKRMIVYRSVQDGLVWIRPASEFFDGRFALEPVGGTLLQERIAALVIKHGSIRKAALALKIIDYSYLWRLLRGSNDNPGDELLHALGLRRCFVDAAGGWQ